MVQAKLTYEEGRYEVMINNTMMLITQLDTNCVKRWIYSVFHVIVLQEQGCCELVLGLIVSPKAFMWPQDWADISFRSETL